MAKKSQLIKLRIIFVLQVDPNKTLNENLADNGGVKEAYKAYKRLLNRSNELIAVKDYTWDQLFFIGYGTVSVSQIFSHFHA